MAWSHNPCSFHSQDDRCKETDSDIEMVFQKAPFGRLQFGQLLMSVLGGVLGVREGYTEGEGRGCCK